MNELQEALRAFRRETTPEQARKAAGVTQAQWASFWLTSESTVRRAEHQVSWAAMPFPARSLMALWVARFDGSKKGVDLAWRSVGAWLVMPDVTTVLDAVSIILGGFDEKQLLGILVGDRASK